MVSAKFRKSPIRKLSLKSGILPKIAIQSTENIFPDAKNAFLAALEDTNIFMLNRNLSRKNCFTRRVFRRVGTRKRYVVGSFAYLTSKKWSLKTIISLYIQRSPEGGGTKGSFWPKFDFLQEIRFDSVPISVGLLHVLGSVLFGTSSV